MWNKGKKVLNEQEVTYHDKKNNFETSILKEEIIQRWYMLIFII